MYKLFFRSFENEELLFTEINGKIYLVDTGCSCDIILYKKGKISGDKDTMWGVGGKINCITTTILFEGVETKCWIIKPVLKDVHGVIGLPILKNSKIDFKKCLLTLNLKS